MALVVTCSEPWYWIKSWNLDILILFVMLQRMSMCMVRSGAQTMQAAMEQPTSCPVSVGTTAALRWVLSNLAMRRFRGRIVETRCPSPSELTVTSPGAMCSLRRDSISSNVLTSLSQVCSGIVICLLLKLMQKHCTAFLLNGPGFTRRSQIYHLVQCTADL